VELNQKVKEKLSEGVDVHKKSTIIEIGPRDLGFKVVGPDWISIVPRTLVSLESPWILQKQKSSDLLST
jgi:hypothetical protein